MNLEKPLTQTTTLIPKVVFYTPHFSPKTSVFVAPQIKVLGLKASFHRNMGNCLESCKYKQRDMEQEDHQHQQQEEEKEAGGFRVKILVSKEELDCLLYVLKEKGAKRLEDVLVEIGRDRRRAEGWKPSLDSITESPEVQTVVMGR